jgi:hypothetical protein
LSSWQTESGLLDKFQIDIEEAWFGKDEKFGDNLIFNLRGPAIQEGEVVDEEHTLKYSCGDGWEARKGGQEASHKAGKTSFNKSSNMGKLIDSLVGQGDEILEELQSRGEAYEAATWIGLSLFIEREAFSYTDRNTKETRTYEVPLVTDYLGVVEGEDEKPAKKAPARARKAKSEDAEETPKPRARRTRKKKEEEPEVDLRAELVALAGEFDDDDDGHQGFVEAAFDPDEFDHAEALQADEELSNEVLDMESDLWAEAHE